MSRFNTGNPLGSGSPLDLDDNAKNMDLATNSIEPTWTDRFGMERPTLAAAVDPSGLVQTAVNAADRAETALAGVEQALGLNAANIYISVASGLAATEDTENFWVIPNEGDGIENLTLYNNNASVAVKLYELYNLESYMVEEGSNWETGEL